jgi:hypothetical protein
MRYNVYRRVVGVLLPPRNRDSTNRYPSVVPCFTLGQTTLPPTIISLPPLWNIVQLSRVRVWARVFGGFIGHLKFSCIKRERSQCPLFCDDERQRERENIGTQHFIITESYIDMNCGAYALHVPTYI